MTEEENDSTVETEEQQTADEPDEAGTGDAGAEAEEIDTSKSAPEDRSSAGPFDTSEVPSIRPYVDLGGIKIAPREGLQMRLEVDERAKRVVAASLEYAGSLLQVQAFAAPKSRGMWHQIRADLTAQLSQQGAVVKEEDGDLGPELLSASKAPEEQGGGARVARFIGVDGPRWILRGIIMGNAAIDSESRAKLVDLFREIVVVRGDTPMPPGDLIPMHLPAGVQPSAQAQGGGAGAADGE